MSTPDPVLQIHQLSAVFGKGENKTYAVKELSFQVKAGQTLGIVGESGSGKSMTALSIMGLLPKAGTLESGELVLRRGTEEIDLRRASERQMQGIRGKSMGMIFQEPMTSLNPVHRCGDQVAEVLRLHQNLSKGDAKTLTLDWFRKVQLPRVEELYRSYPHQLSGGQKQRVMIAMAACCHPQLLIADEPTTALDVTVQKGMLDLLRELQEEEGMGMMFITHDLGVVAEIADEVLVMYKGEAVEYGGVADLFSKPQHPYTKGLLACRPPLDQKPRRLPTVKAYLEADGKLPPASILKPAEQQQRVSELTSQPPLLVVDQLKTWFPIRKGMFSRSKEYVKAVNGVSFSVYPGETLGLVGESGCGKTTLGRSILRLIEPTDGSIQYQGQALMEVSSAEMRALRKDLQIIFQDPYSSLNPRLTIGSAILEPMQVHDIGTSATERKEKVLELLEQVGLAASHVGRYPHEFSGGQRQRVCIARALAVEPRFIICDESVSALDVSVQAQVLNLLKDLQEERQLTYIFISHDLGVVQFMSDRMMVMQAGKIVEAGPAESVYGTPQTVYTQQLIEAIPIGSLERIQFLQQQKKSGL